MKYTAKNPLSPGYNPMVSASDHPEMMGMEFGVYVLRPGDKAAFDFPQEVVYDLLFGEVCLRWAGGERMVRRADCFHEDAIVLHVPQGTHVEVECLSEPAEIAIARTANPRAFAPRLLFPDDCLFRREERGIGVMDGMARRDTRTFFDRSVCPETNFYIGEVVHQPGKWSSFPPHTHVEPELYYYKFLPENGFALAEYGDDAYKVKHNDLLGMSANVTHAQACTPGYAEFYLWCIRLQDDKPLVSTFVPEYEWVNDPDARFFPNEK
ncbi:MAG: 5-deoxy-glucuronate isomerase [Clostridiaceae bacterium]|nr:5-deoxy-glucuronate isomerase [Clostridiaceae bacterium]